MDVTLQGICPLIQVFDMPTSLKFYCELLGFELENHAPPYAEGLFHWAFLRGHGGELMLNTAYEADERPAVPVAARAAAHRDTTFYFGCSDVEAAYRELLDRGLLLHPPKLAPYGMKQLYFSDPDGYGVCLQHPV